MRCGRGLSSTFADRQRRGPKQHPSHPLQETVSLHRRHHRGLGHCDDPDGPGHELWRSHRHTFHAWCLRVSRSLSSHAGYECSLTRCRRAGFFPGAVYTVSRWYLPNETQLRISLFYVSSALSGAISGLLAFAIAKMDGIAGVAGWKWICKTLPPCQSLDSSLIDEQSSLKGSRLWLLE